MNNGPLEGIRITEFTSAWAGPYATCMLGFLGAEVIKVESRTYLDHSRQTAFTTGKTFTGPNESSVFNTLNLNKKSVTLNLKNPKSIEIAKKLSGSGGEEKKSGVPANTDQGGSENPYLAGVIKNNG